jgi:hypothetical protein
MTGVLGGDPAGKGIVTSAENRGTLEGSSAIPELSNPWISLYAAHRAVEGNSLP